jgi:hypothetical protein
MTQELFCQKLVKSLLYLIAYVLGQLLVGVDIDNVSFCAPVRVQVKVTKNAPAFKRLLVARLDLYHTAIKFINAHGACI